MAAPSKDVATVGEPLLDDNPDRFCMFPIKYPVSGRGPGAAACRGAGSLCTACVRA
jgi:hypothetical protein